jgi:hypothetical protein
MRLADAEDLKAWADSNQERLSIGFMLWLADKCALSPDVLI